MSYECHRRLTSILVRELYHQALLREPGYDPGLPDAPLPTMVQRFLRAKRRRPLPSSITRLKRVRCNGNIHL
jgi:hypothetical protein